MSNQSKLKTVYLLASIVLFITLTSGVYRHDTPIEKYLELAAQKEFDCVGLIYSNNIVDKDTNFRIWERNGSCVLIDSLHILTAAHCVVGEIKKDTVVDYRGYKLNTYIVVGEYLRPTKEFWILVNNQPVFIKSIICHPNYLLKSNASYNNYDIAILELEKPVSNFVKIKLNKEQNEINDTVIGVGYGGSAPSNPKQFAQQYGIKLAGTNIIDSIGGEAINGIKSQLFIDFDSPFKDETNSLGNSTPTELEYGTIGGDSGGTLFRRKNGELQLIGLLSGNDGSIPRYFEKYGYYGGIDRWIRIAAFWDWIEANRK